MILTGVGSLPARSDEYIDGACRIAGGHAALLADQILPDGTIAYRGAILIVTHGCGDSPKGVSGTFRPVAGTPTSCSPIASPRIDEAACAFAGNLGLGLEGTPVVVTATAYTSGVINEHVHDRDTAEELGDARFQPGAETVTSECVVMMPEDGGRFGCSLF